MFKRMVIATALVAALGTCGFSVGSKAQAWDDCSIGYRAYYPSYAYPNYAAYYGYRPNVAYGYPLVIRSGDFHDGHHHHHGHHHHDRGHVSFSIGF